MVSSAARDVRPHSEERGCGRRSANSNARARVSKDGDERLGSPSCFETHRSAFGLRKRLRSRRAAMLLSMRERGRRAFWRNEAKRAYCVRAYWRAWSGRNTNLRLCEMKAGAASLFPACSLQGMVQLQRVGAGEGPLTSS